MKAYEEVRQLPDHPFNKFTTTRRPFIWVYREALAPGLSIPKAIYNGELSSAAIQDWALMLACTVGYEEGNDVSQGGMDSYENIVVASLDNNYIAPVVSTEFSSPEYRDQEVAYAEAVDNELDHREYAPDDYIVRPLSDATFSRDGFRKRDPGYLAGFNSYQL
jgi:hypothetical protein